MQDKLSLITPDLIRRKPIFLIRAFFRSFLIEFGFNRSLRSVLFHTHYKCNLHCRHCYERNFIKTDKSPLSLSEKKRAISDCIKLGALSFDFVSGESSLDPNLPDLVKACQPYKTYISLASNGYDLDEHKIKYYHEIGIDKLNISLDSYYPDEHNSIRGKKDAHQKALETLDICNKVGMGFHITVFVYKESTKSLGFKKLVEWAIRNRIRTTFKTAVPLGALEGVHDYLITDDDRECLYRLHRKYPFLVRTCICTENSTCPAFSHIIAISAYGDVLPCNTVHISFGNIRDEDIGSIINRGKKNIYFNGTYKGCPPSEDMFFIRNYLTKIYSVVPYPPRSKNVFMNEIGEVSNDSNQQPSII